MSAMTSPSPSQPSTAVGLRIQMLELELARKDRELVEWKKSQEEVYNQALATMSALEAENERLKLILCSVGSAELRSLQATNVMLSNIIPHIQGNANRYVDLLGARMSRIGGDITKGQALIDQGEAMTKEGEPITKEGMALIHEGSEIIRRVVNDNRRPVKEEEDLVDGLQARYNVQYANPAPSATRFGFHASGSGAMGSESPRTSRWSRLPYNTTMADSRSLGAVVRLEKANELAEIEEAGRKRRVGFEDS